MLIEDSSDSSETSAADVLCINQPNGFCGLLYNNNLLGVFILEVTEGRDGYQTFFLFLPIACAYTAATITGVEVIDQSLEADDKVIVLIEGVDAFGGGEHTHVVFPQVVNEQCRLRTMAPQTGQIFDDDGFDGTRLYRFIDFVDALTVEVHAADIVIERLTDYFVTVGQRIFIDDFSLVCQRVQFFIFIS